MEIIENFLPEGLAETVYHKITHPEMNWRYTEESTLTDITNPQLFVVDENTIKPCQFIIPVFHDYKSQNQDLFMFCDFVFQYASEKLGIEPVDFYRIKINLLTRDVRFTENSYGIAHSDVGEVTDDKSYKSLLYYVNDSDGDTFMFNEYASENKNTKLTLNKRITPQAGKAVYFDSTRFHASSNPVVNTSRFVINYTFKI